MSQQLTTRVKGLYTFPNPLSEVPDGALIVADNTVIDREGTIEPRRGFSFLAGILGTDNENRAHQIFPYGGNVIAHYGIPGSEDSLAFYAPEVDFFGVQTSSSKIITGLASVSGLFVGQYISGAVKQQVFVGDVLNGSNTLSNVTSNQGLYVGQDVGGFGIPAGTTITGISGSSSFTITISNNATGTLAGTIFTASNASILGFPSNTVISVVGTTTIEVSNNCTISSRQISFNPSDVDTTADSIALTNHGLTDGDGVQFSSSGTLPAPLTTATPYYVVSSSGSAIKVSATSGGSVVDLTTQGTGTHTLTVRNDIQAFGWIDYSGTYTQPDSNTKIRSVEANSNVYFTTSSGMQKLDSISTTPVMSGAPKGLDVSAVLSTGASGFMQTNTQVSYRVVWGYRDANANLILGVPSQRAVVSNSGVTTKDVDLDITIPSEVTTTYFFQVYRSGFSANSDTEPNDEMALIYEANPTSGDITAKSVSITDRTPESLRTGATLYTSPSQEGIAQANEPPPFAKDVTLFKGSTFYGNTRTKQSYTVSILSVSGQFNIKGNTTNTGGDTPTTVRVLTSSVTGDITTGSSTIANVSDVSNIAIGQGISGTGIPADSIVIEVVSSTSIKINNAATATTATLAISLDITGLLVGQIVSGTGIPANTTVTNVYTPISATGNTVNGSAVISNTSIAASSFKVGQPITGTGIPSNTVVLSITGVNELTLSKNATADGTAVALSFGNGFQMSNGATATNAAVTLTLKNGTNGIQLDDTITIAGDTYTAKLVENIASKQFKVFAQGSPAQNIGDTALSLVRVVNRTSTPTPTVYAYYQSGFSSLPGKILFQERTLGGAQFTLTASARGSAYSPNLPTSGTTTNNTSSNDTFANGLYFSKTQQPEAVPLLNIARIGTANAAILRVIPLRDSLFILKEDGIFRLTGESPSNFRIDLFDSTTKILAADSAVPLNNQIFMLSTQGVVSVSDTGVTVVSHQIEDKFLDLFEQSLEKAANLSFGISYETDRKYILFCIESSADEEPTQAFVWNTFTNTWTRWVLNKTCGIVHPSIDALYLGDAVSDQFNVERKDRRYTDYVDDSFDDIIISYSGKDLVLNSISDVEVGDVVWQTAGRFSLITAVDTTTSTVTVKDTLTSWTLGNIAILKGIESIVEYTPQTAKNPGALKQFRETALLFQVPFFNSLELSFNTDLSANEESLTLTGQYGALWGLFPWGSVPWGGISKPLSIRTYVPQQKQRCSLLNVKMRHKEAYAFYRLNGISYIHNGLSERVGI